MNRTQFNTNLTHIGEVYQKCIILKKILNGFEDEKIENDLSMIGNLKKTLTQGCIEREIVLQHLNSYRNGNKYLVTNNKIIKNQALKIKEETVQENGELQIYQMNQLQQIFPHNKISYSNLIKTCKKGLNHQNFMNPLTEPKNNKQDKPVQLIIDIIALEMEMNAMRKKLIPSLPVYIPTISSKNLNVEDLQDYINECCHNDKNNFINASSIILALNGVNGNPTKLEYEFAFENEKDNKHCIQKQESSSSDEDEKGSRINQILNRLNKRVDSFGNEWLLNKQ